MAPVGISEDSFDAMPTDGDGDGEVWDDDVGDRDGEYTEEAEERVALASLQRQMCRPLSHLWALPRQRVAGAVV